GRPASELQGSSQGAACDSGSGESADQTSRARARVQAVLPPDAQDFIDGGGGALRCYRHAGIGGGRGGGSGDCRRQEGSYDSSSSRPFIGIAMVGAPPG